VPPLARLRTVAWEALGDLLPALDGPLGEVLAGAPAERVLDRFLRAHRQLDGRGRAAASEALFGVGLWRRRLRWHLGARPETPRLLLALLLRDLADRADAPGLAGLPPDALPPPRPPPTGLADRWSLPDWLAAELLAAAGEEAGALAEALCLPGPLFLRVNTLRATREALAARLAGEGIPTRPGRLATTCLQVVGPRPNLLGLDAWREGWLEVQDEGSQLLAEALGARPGEAVLDRCAGAGGKALALAAAVGRGGRVHCCDLDEARLRRLATRARRAGASDLVALHGAAPPADLLVDRALVDAPCSELGPLRRGPDLRWRLEPAAFAALPAIQGALLAEAAGRVRPGGRLLYATCTFRRAENEGVALAFEAAHPGWRRIRPEAPAAVLGPDGFLRAMPHRHGTDGFFAAAWDRLDSPHDSP
jgi:16S rRNA (cytosine967-C5)-methyltransferase